MLREIKNNRYHYYTDAKGIQGEYKAWFIGGELGLHRIYKDNKYHGEYKSWNHITNLVNQRFYRDNVNITKEVKELVSDINNITKEERMMIKLKFGIRCLS